MISSEDSSKIHQLLVDLKVDLNNFYINPIGLGKNNRTYFVSTNENKFLAKFYYSSSKDSRNRLNNEFNFLEYLEEIGINNAPKPVTRSDLHNLGIYEFIEGKPFASSDINKDSIFLMQTCILLTKSLDGVVIRWKTMTDM